jgi:hypothetical protein
VQRAALLLLHHLHPTIPTRAELHCALVDAQTPEDDVQCAIDDLASAGVIATDPSDQTVRLPLAVLTTLELIER